MKQSKSLGKVRTPQQNILLHGLLKQLRIDADHKEQLVLAFTEGRETSSAEMTLPECDLLIKHLKERVTKLGNRNNASSKDPNSPENKMRRKIISYCHEMRMQKQDGKIDMNKVNAFILVKGYLKKDLNSYTAKELQKLVSQVKNIRDSFLKRI